MPQTLVDRIYECAFEPALWPETLDEIAKISGSRGGGFLTAQFKGGVLRSTASPALYDDIASYVSEDWLQRDRRSGRVTKAAHDGFLTDYDVFSPEELAQDSAHCEFFRPRGIGWRIDTAAPLPTGDWFIFTFPRDYALGPVDATIIAQLDALRPHLARSALLSARLQLERARIASEALAFIGVPALVLDDHARVIAANTLIETMTDHLRWRARDRASFRDPRAEAQFCQACETLHVEKCQASAPVRSFAVRDADARAAMVAHLVPIRGGARDVFVRCAAVLVLTPVTVPHAPPIELIRSLFDLTPSEARVARRIAIGETVDEIAAGSGVTRNTVRSQLRNVLEKTGCRRQAEIVALLGGVASLPYGEGGDEFG